MISVWKGLSLLAVSELGGTVRRNVTVLTLYGVGLIIGLMGVVFALLASQVWLERHMSTMSAQLLIAAALFVLAAIVVLVGIYISRRRRTPSPIASTALIAAPFAARIVGRKINLGTLTMLGVIAAGAVIGRQLGRD